MTWPLLASLLKCSAFDTRDLRRSLIAVLALATFLRSACSVHICTGLAPTVVARTAAQLRWRLLSQAHGWSLRSVFARPLRRSARTGASLLTPIGQGHWDEPARRRHAAQVRPFSAQVRLTPVSSAFGLCRSAPSARTLSARLLSAWASALIPPNRSPTPSARAPFGSFPLGSVSRIGPHRLGPPARPLSARFPRLDPLESDDYEDYVG